VNTETDKNTLEKLLGPQWFHPYLLKTDLDAPVKMSDLEAYAYDYFLRFLPFFRKQPEGSLHPGTRIKFTGRMKRKLGLADMPKHEIRLNKSYFLNDPKLLPYTLFHEMIHLWLFDCYLDPGHTRRFYLKMSQFEKTALPIDQAVHIHSRLSAEGNYIYICPSCDSRWYLARMQRKAFACGHCWETKKNEVYPAYFSKAGRIEDTISKGE
jgi:predicted SprT family Zn-dependent metalloprotease